ncbi:LON peptidase substrate-binding domain-containing protein [Duganella sp. sic0402]|uniref:LON peptidase substrate-binding domain-containing protein n=1 Tax=Duganella sp. sic0402 TaxID=2854786 RepID=UPI001C475A4D|nr:LON peptidase substrate-binding domain-containing protein [Duganella sp. sic0402]MBV7534278.1 LON peptidase substrate-binding domain-containing protein [Duganella sp. sic0402]
MPSIPLFPLKTILFPDGHLPLQVFEVRYLDLVKRCIAKGEEFGVVSLLDGSEVRVPDQHETLSACGTMARIMDWSAPLPGLLQISCIGTTRFQVKSAEQLKHGLWMAEVDDVAEDMVVPIPSEQQDVANALGALIRSLQKKQISTANMSLAPPYRLDEAGWVANRWCELLRLDLEEKQRLLLQENPVLRLELVQDVLSENGLLD